MLLITSGALVSEELRAEFGPIPPVMLPLGNRSLLAHQLEAIRAQLPGERLALSLPASHQLVTAQRMMIAQHKVQVVRVTDRLSLGCSVAEAVKSAGIEPDEPLRILHGDTLVRDIPRALDIIAVSTTRSGYNWKFEGGANDDPVVWCGYFAFAKAEQLLSELAASGDFVEAVIAYQRSRDVALLPVNEWFDLGHMNTFFDSRERFTTERAFNSLRIVKHQVWKSSKDGKKILAEAKWYASLPPDLKRYTPQLIEVDENTSPPRYRTEYLRHVPLNELFVFGANPRPFWRNILDLCQEYLAECVAVYRMQASTHGSEDRLRWQSRDLLCTKTWERLGMFSRARSFDLDAVMTLNGKAVASVRRITEQCVALACAEPTIPAFVHGDFCFSNILYDSRANAIKVVDPRGLSGDGEETAIGDLGYDIAKLLHSAVGLYDIVMAGHYAVDFDGRNNMTFELHSDMAKQEVAALFADSVLVVAGQKARAYMPAVVLLFLSMLPLHADSQERQNALLANAIRLYDQWER